MMQIPRPVSMAQNCDTKTQDANPPACANCPEVGYQNYDAHPSACDNGLEIVRQKKEIRIPQPGIIFLSGHLLGTRLKANNIHIKRLLQFSSKIQIPWPVYDSILAKKINVGLPLYTQCQHGAQ